MTEIPEDLLANYTTAKRNPEWFYQTIARLIERIAKAEAQLSLLQWTAIEEGNLPKVGDEVGGWFGVFDPQWEVRPFKWPMPSSQSLKPEIIKEGCRIAGWTHFRPINPPAPPTDKEQK